MFNDIECAVEIYIKSLASKSMETLRPEIISRTLYESFNNWGKRDTKYNKTFKKLQTDDYRVITSAFAELNPLRPGTYDMWWAREHMRFKNISGQQMRYVHELMYAFLTKYSRGTLHEYKIEKENKRNSENKVGKKKRSKAS